jgi:hypothetical protein
MQTPLRQTSAWPQQSFVLGSQNPRPSGHMYGSPQSPLPGRHFQYHGQHETAKPSDP